MNTTTIATRRGLGLVGALAAGIALAASGFAQEEKPVKGETAPPAPAAGGAVAIGSSYRVEPGDVLDIVVLGKPELSQQVQVLPEGTVQYRYLGILNVAGLRMAELVDLLTKRLSREIRDPEVNVRVLARAVKEVSAIGGALRGQGKRVMKEDWRVLDLIVESGGLVEPEHPEWFTAKLLRNSEKFIDIDLTRLLGADKDPAANIPLQPGDVLMTDRLPESRTHVSVVGEVARPNQYPIPRDRSLSQLVLTAGNLTPRAALAGAVIKRGVQQIPVDLTGLVRPGVPVPEVKLEPGDTLVIPVNTQVFALFGAVNRPGSVEYPENEKLTILTAITKGGGWAGDADLKRVHLIRPGADGKAVVKDLNIEPLVQGNKQGNREDLEIKPGDALYIEGKGPRKPGFGIGDIAGLWPVWGLFLRR